MTPIGAIVQLSDLDLLLREAHDVGARTRLRKLGFELEGLPRIERERARVAATIERRWMNLYERARQRYKRAVASVRERVCQGCFVTLPTSAAPRPGDIESIGLCQSCGRILYWV